MQLIKTASIKTKLDSRNITNPILCQVATMDEQSWKNIDWNIIKNENDLRIFFKRFLHSGPAREILNNASKTQKEKLDSFDPDPYTEGMAYEERDRLEREVDQLISWESFLLKPLEREDLTYQHDVAFKYLIVNSFINQTRLKPNIDALQSFYILFNKVPPREINKNPTVIGKKKLFKSYEMEVENSEDDDLKSYRIDTSNINGWVEIPKGGDNKVEAIEFPEDVRSLFPSHDFEPLRSRGLFVSDLCKGKGWCIGNIDVVTGHLYLPNGRMFLYVESGEPKVCITFSGSRIKEITGACNAKQNAYIYADQLLKFYDDHPSLQSALDGYGLNSEQALPDFKNSAMYSKEQIEKWSKASPEEIARNFNKAVNYLLDSKIEECTGNKEFEQAAKNFILKKGHHFERSGPKFEHQIGRFPFLKKDKEIVDVGVGHIKDSLTNLYDGRNPSQSDVMNFCHPSRLNNKLKSMPMKNKEIRGLVFNSYMDLLSGRDEHAQLNKMFDDISKMAMKSGVTKEFKDLATKECVDSLEKSRKLSLEGHYDAAKDEISKFDIIRVQFGLNEDMGNFKDAHFDLILKIAPNSLVENEDEFGSLDKFLGGKLTSDEYYPGILEKALSIAETKTIDALNNKSVSIVKDCFKRFPALKKRELVLNSVVTHSANWMVYDAKLFQDINEIFNRELSDGIYYEKIHEAAFDDAVQKASILALKGNVEELSELNENFKGSIFLNNWFIDQCTQDIAHWLAVKATDKYSKLIQVLGDKLKPHIDTIKDKVYLRVFNQATIAFSKGDSEMIKDLNKRTLGRLMEKKDEIINSSKKMAVNYALEELLNLDVIKAETYGNPILSVRQINNLHNGAISQDASILERCKKISVYCSARRNKKYYDNIVEQIKKLFGREIIRQEDYDHYRNSQKQNAKENYIRAIESDNYFEAERLIVSFPELKLDRQLISRTIRKVSILSRNLYDAKYKLKTTEELDVLFDGKILSSKIGAIAYDKLKEFVSIESHKKFKKPQVTKKVQEPQDDFNMANNWYSLSKIS